MQIERKQMKLGGAIFTFIFFYGSRNKNKNSKTKMKVGIVENRYRAVTKRTPLIMQKKNSSKGGPALKRVTIMFSECPRNKLVLHLFLHC
jgi:hypothetical protein